jgi:hypothetical protein
MTQKEPARAARHGCRESARGRMRRPRVLREAPHCPAMDKITINFGSPFGSLPVWLPISLAPLTFNNPNGSLKSLLPGHASPGAIDDREPDVQP